MTEESDSIGVKEGAESVKDGCREGGKTAKRSV
jgi:hypothetical protein